jgi:hypothetical protein
LRALTSMNLGGPITAKLSGGSTVATMISGTFFFPQSRHLESEYSFWPSFMSYWGFSITWQNIHFSSSVVNFSFLITGTE